MARFNIKNFVSEINKSGTLQTNRFEVNFAPPLIMQNVKIDGIDTSDTVKLINLRAESAKIPGIGLLMTDVNRYGVGPMQKMPYSAAFTSVPITFVTDRKNSIHKFFYTWLSSIFSVTPDASLFTDKNTMPTGAYQTEYKDYYTTDITINIYDVYGTKIQEIVMYRAFPEAMNDVNLNWSENNALMKIGVSFSFRDWAMINLNYEDNRAKIESTNLSNKFKGEIANFADGTDPTLTSKNNTSKVEPGKSTAQTQTE